MHIKEWVLLGLALFGSGGADNVAAIRAMLIEENGEPLVDLQEQAIIAYGTAFVLENPGCTKVREGVYTRLCKAQQLLPLGIRFRVDVGLRSLAVQRKLFAKTSERIQNQFPQMNEKELFFETSKFVAPVTTWEGVTNVPPHSTGGAIDVVLIDEQGNPLDMGISQSDSYDEDLIKTDSLLISAEARKNRDMMGQALSAVGFVNYPAEFWHWSYGDKRWAFAAQTLYSIYGPVLAE